MLCSTVPILYNVFCLSHHSIESLLGGQSSPKTGSRACEVMVCKYVHDVKQTHAACGL